ncbi:MAG: nuclear transport factor 2 family protein [Chitinophagaceae bacterium]|nr:MAG: nuclear transport factor 2 family protein [Chitinophagaceae bacterium]
MRRFRFFVFIVLFLISATAARAQATPLHQTIARLDSTFFAAYNNCDIALQSAFYADSLEFYHDRNGLDTSKANILAATRKYICGKVTRELIPGSLEVSPLPGFGAVEVGMHQFRNNQEPGQVPHPSRFIILWRERAGKWQITKVISLH